MNKRKLVYGLTVATLLAAHAPHAAAQARTIYTCVDAQGRTLTSDRPIRQCIDREQRILGGATTHERGVLPRSYTQQELAEMRAEEARRQEQRRLERDLRQRERTLRVRYPDQESHDRARAEAKAQVETVIAGARLNLEELDRTRKSLHEELEFYQSDIKKAPHPLRQQITANAKQIEDQQKFIQAQEGEKKRIDTLYDQELETLKRIWAEHSR